MAVIYGDNASAIAIIGIIALILLVVGSIGAIAWYFIANVIRWRKGK